MTRDQLKAGAETAQAFAKAVRKLAEAQQHYHPYQALGQALLADLFAGVYHVMEAMADAAQEDTGQAGGSVDGDLGSSSQEPDAREHLDAAADRDEAAQSGSGSAG